MRTMNTGRPLLQDRAAGLEELPWAGATNLQQAAACTAQMTWRPYSELENSTAIWSRNTTEYNAYGGIDLQPNHQRPLPLAFAASAESGRLTPFTSEPALQVGECTADSPDGGVWHTQRVGPMVSTGGYDWHALSWRDPAFMSQAARTASTKQQTGTSGRKSEEMWGGAVGLLGHFTGPSHGSQCLRSPLHPCANCREHVVCDRSRRRDGDPGHLLSSHPPTPYPRSGSNPGRSA
jgi:hypothetical protein